MSDPAPEPTIEDLTCGWPIDTACCGDLSEKDADLVQRAKNLAVMTLRSLTAYRVGGCPVKVRPCAMRCYPPSAVLVGTFNPGIVNGEWVNGCGCPSGGCGCSALSKVLLPPPIGAIEQVLVDGSVLDPDLYRVLDGRYLIRTDGGTWPTCQHLDRETTEVGTFEVTYLNAYPPDGNAAYAAGLMVCEYIKACEGSKGCQLSPKVRTISRRGLQMELSDEAFPDGLTGITVVDAFIKSWNPARLTMPPKVLSPDKASPSYVGSP